jgi:hypothetical protein
MRSFVLRRLQRRFPFDFALALESREAGQQSGAEAPQYKSRLSIPHSALRIPH